MKSIEKIELSPDALVERVKGRKREIERVLTGLEKALQAAPEGRLKIVKNGSYIQYYHRKTHAASDGIYLKRAQDSLAAELAQKDYDRRMVNELKSEIDALERVVDRYHPERIDEIFHSLHDGRKNMIYPVRLLDEEYVKRWESVAYEKKGFKENAAEYYTVKGERVRSKSEIMIADALSRHGIPYRYEYPMQIAGLGTVHPDFICLNVRERKEYIWEHFGMMSDPDYAENAVYKIEKYTLADYFPGKKVILTFETNNYPLNSRVIEKNIVECFF